MSGSKNEESQAETAARKEFMDTLETTAERMGLGDLVDDHMREKWAQLQHVTHGHAERQRMAETVLLIHHAMT